MANQKHLITVNEKKETNNTNEDIVKQIGLRNILLHNKNQTPFEITSTKGRNLIPRAVATNLVVFAANHIPAPNANNNNMDMELHNAAYRGYIQQAQNAVRRNRNLLRLRELNGRNLPLHIALMRGHRQVAFYLVREYPEGSYALNRNNDSPIYLAVVRYPRDLELVENMLDRPDANFNVFAELKERIPVVRAAINHQNLAMLRLILRYHRDLYKCQDNEEGLTPLSYAASIGCRAIVRYIMHEFPRSLIYRNRDNSYPIHKACLGGHVRVLGMFHSKDPNSFFATDSDGRNILHLVARERNNNLMPVVTYILNQQEGRQLIRKRDRHEHTALDLAERRQNHQVANLIRGFGG